MNYISSITSQGQLTVPKPLRDKYGISKQAKVLIRDLGNHLEIRPHLSKDLLSLYGILKNNPRVQANKGKSIQSIISEENQAFKQALTKP